MWTERDLQTMLDPQLFYQGRLIELNPHPNMVIFSWILSQKFGTKMSVPTLWK